MKRFRVIPGGKGGGKPSSASGIKLFRAYSIGKFTRGELTYSDVRFNWYCLDREQQSASYKELIAGYDELDENSRRALKRDIDRCFTQEEVASLRSYISQRYGMDLAGEEVALPLRERTYFFEEGSSVIYDFLELSEKEGYSLPFKVWGYYTLQDCLPSPSLENAVRFLEKAFELLDIYPDFGKNQLEAVSKTIYEQEGLVVEKRDKKM